MLGSATGADDVVQQACLRWSQYSKPVDSPRSFLATLVVRLCLDQLGSARARRVDYIGPWLPEPLLAGDSGPAEAAELADSLCMAFLVLLEELTPAGRTALLLHDVSATDTPEIASTLGRQEPAAGSWSPAPGAGSASASAASMAAGSKDSSWRASSWPPVRPAT